MSKGAKEPNKMEDEAITLSINQARRILGKQSKDMADEEIVSTLSDLLALAKNFSSQLNLSLMKHKHSINGKQK